MGKFEKGTPVWIRHHESKIGIVLESPSGSSTWGSFPYKVEAVNGMILHIDRINLSRATRKDYETARIVEG